MAVSLLDIVTFHRRFNSVQKAAILGVLSVISAIFLGNVVVFTSFVTSFVLAVLALRHLLSLQRHMGTDKLLPVMDKIEAIYVTIYKALFGELPPKIAAKQIHVSGDPESEAKAYLQFVLRDFIHSWYDYLSSDRECLDEFRDILDGIVLSTFERLKGVNVHETIQRLTYVVQCHLQDYFAAKYEWETLPHYRKKAGNTAEFKKYQTIVHVFRSQRKFHPAMENEERELQYLRSIVEIILKVLISPRMYNCYAAKELLKEILVNKIMIQIVDMVSKPHWLHETLSKITMDEDPIRIDTQMPDNDQPSDQVATEEQSEETSVMNLTESEETLEDNHQLTRRRKNKKNKSGDRQTFISHIADGGELRPVLKRANTAPGSITSLGPGSERFEKDNLRMHLHLALTDNNSSGTSATVSEESMDEQEAPVMPSRRRSNSFSSECRSELDTPSIGGDVQGRAFIWSNVGEGMNSEQMTDGHDRSSLENFPSSGNELDAVTSGTASGPITPDTTQCQPTAINIQVSPATPDGPMDTVISSSLFYISNGDDISLSSNCSGVSTETNNMQWTAELESQSGISSSRQTLLDDSSRRTTHELVQCSTQTLGAVKVVDSEINPECEQNDDHDSVENMSPAVQSEVSNMNTIVFSPGIHVEQAQRVSHREGPGDQRQHSEDSDIFLNSYDNITESEEVDEAAEALSTLDGDTHLPPDMLIMKVKIPATETMTERYNQKPFVLYVIEYEAWHRNEASTGWFIRKDRVMRRFREFVTLHERLEEHGIYKRVIKNIKGPKKWKFLPMRHINDKEVESRRFFLQKYLQELIVIKQICNSMAIREFLAYEGDTRLAFVKKAPEIPRIDKTIMRTVSGAWRKVTDVVMPDDPVQRQSSRKKARHRSHHKSKCKRKLDMRDWRDVDAIQLEMEEELAEVSRLERTLGKCVQATIEKYDSDYEDSSEEESGRDEMSEFADALEGIFVGGGHKRRDETDSGISDDGKELDDCKIPIASAILDAAVQTADERSYWVVQEKSIRILKVLIGKLLDTYLREEIQDLVSEKRCTFYLHELREVLWPGGVLDTNPVFEPSVEQKTMSRAQCRRCLLSFLPFYIPLVVGHGTFAECIDEVMACLDHYNLNRHLGFCLLDLLIEIIFPEIDTAAIQDELITGTRPRAESMAKLT